jgi:ubiquinone/menaquinone biosynthesis C-methylase UbiE
MARYRQVVAEIPPTPKQKILDIGCGDGVLPYLIYQKTKSEITGVDTDKESLKAGERKLAEMGAKIKLVEGSAYQLPFAKNYFDVVIATEVIEHLQNTEKFLAEMGRVLKPGGKVIITTPVKLSAIPEDSMHVKEFTPKELQVVIREYFQKVSLVTTHSLLLKKIYLWQASSLGRVHVEPFRWLINLWVLLTGLNPFLLSFDKSTNQLVLAYK